MRRRFAGGDRAEVLGEGVEAVGVDHQRRLDPADDLAGQLDRARVAAHARPEHPGGGALEGAQQRLRRSRRQAAVAARAADRHHLGLARFEDRLEVGRNGDGRVAGAGPDRRQRGHPHRPGEAARAAGDRHLAGAELGRARARGGAARARTAGSIAPPAGVLGAPGGIPIGTTRSSPVCHLPGAIRWPSLAAWKLTVRSASTADPLDLAAGGVDPGGDVAGDDRRPAAVDRLDRRGGRLARRAGEPGAEDRVDDRPRAGQPGIEVAGQRRRTRGSTASTSNPIAPQAPGGDHAVAAVVPLAADDPHRPLRRQPGDRLGQRRARRLHQLRRGDPLLLDRPAIDRPNPLGVDTAAQPGLHRTAA